MKWFISDLHLGHDAVRVGKRAEYFSSLKEWEDGILDAINTQTKKGDILYILGDLCFKDLPYWRTRIKCKETWLIRGNHDPSTKICTEVFGNKFRDTCTTKLGDTPCWLSHYAHAFWPGSHRGTYHLYGHCHGQREDTLDSWMPERKSLEVCPETIFEWTGKWGAISENQLLRIMKNRKGHDQISFYRKKRSYD